MGSQIPKCYFSFNWISRIHSIGVSWLPKFHLLPKSQEATSELNQAQYYFELVVNDESSDSLYRRALNGGEGNMVF